MRRRFDFAVVAPALAEHAVQGLIVLSRSWAGPLSADEADMLAATCDVLGLVARNDVLSRESRRDAAVHSTSQTLVRAVSRSLDLEETFEEVAVNAALVAGASHCLLLEYRREQDELVTVASSDAEGEELVGMRVQLRDKHDDSARLLSPRYLFVDDVIFGANVSADLRRALSMRSALLVPLLAHDSLLGSLIVYSTSRRERYSETDIARVTEVGEQAAIAIANARLYRDLGRSREHVQALLTRISEIRQTERQKLASVVHDDIMQSMVGARYRLEAFREAVPLNARSEFDEIVGILGRSVADARRIIWELRPPVLDELGLSGALEALARRNDGPHPVSVSCSVVELPDMKRETATALYKIAREAVLNARRHAFASHVWLSLAESSTAEGRVALLNVSDDGVGFDTSQMHESSHFGCAMMQEQAALCGGRISIESAVPRGTSVVAVIPLDRPPEESEDDRI